MVRVPGVGSLETETVSARALSQRSAASRQAGNRQAQNGSSPHSARRPQQGPRSQERRHGCTVSCFLTAARLTPETRPRTAPEVPPLPVHLRPVGPGFHPSLGRPLRGLPLIFDYDRGERKVVLETHRIKGATCWAQMQEEKQKLPWSCSCFPSHNAIIEPTFN